MIEGVVLRWNNRPANRIVLVAGLIVAIASQLLPSMVFASSPFAQLYLRLDRMHINTATGGQVCAKTSATGAGTEATVMITFPSTYTLDTTVAHWTVNTTAAQLPSGATAWPGITAPTSGQVSNVAKTVVFASGNLTNPALLYCFNFTGDGTNPDPVTTAVSSANDQQANVLTKDSGAVVINSTDIALANIADDRILVSATVPPTFQFSMTGNTGAFGTVTPTAGPTGIYTTTSITATVTTNAKGGWVAWAKNTDRGGGANPQGIRSSAAAYTIASTGTVDGAPSTMTGGVENYLFDVDAGVVANGCLTAPDPEYNGDEAAGTPTYGGTLSRFYQPIAQCSGVDANGKGTSSAENFSMVERLTIAGATPAATDYADTIYIVAAGNF